MEAPKYGNDDDAVDLFAKDIVDFTEREHKKLHTVESRFSHGTLSISNNTPQGMEGSRRRAAGARFFTRGRRRL